MRPVVASSGTAWIALASCRPSICGMCMSSTASAKGWPRRCACRIRSRASAPLAAHSTCMCQPSSWRWRISRLVGLSSTTSTCTLARPMSQHSAPTAVVPASSGISIQNCAPSPGVLLTPMRPPISSTSRRQIARPRPVPPYWRVVEPSSWAKCSKILRCASSGIPMPVSSTLTRRRQRSPASVARRTRATTSPCSVNLTALLIRLATTWRMRKGSPRRLRRASGGMSATSSRPFFSAGWANMASAFSISSPGSNSTSSSSRWPDSIFEKSRMSLMMPSRWRPEFCTASAKWRCSALSEVSSSNSVMPSTPFIGVRISWLMVARKSLLAWLAASAASFARSSSRVRTATSSSNWSRCAARRPSRSAICASMRLKPSASESSSTMPLVSARAA